MSPEGTEETVQQETEVEEKKDEALADDVAEKTDEELKEDAG